MRILIFSCTAASVYNSDRCGSVASIREFGLWSPLKKYIAGALQQTHGLCSLRPIWQKKIINISNTIFR